MTTVNISIKKPNLDGSYSGPETGSLTFTPFRRHVDAENNIILPIGFTVELENGEASVQLAATDGTWAWQVEEKYGKDRYLRYVEVPESEQAVSYAGLTDVTPKDLAPLAAGDGRILKIMIADDAEQAQELSAAHPDYVVLYDLTAVADQAAEMSSRITALAAQADADAKSVTAAKSGVLSDSGTVSTLAASVADDARTITQAASRAAQAGESIESQAANVESQAADAVVRISDAVARVEARADDANADGDDDSPAETTPDSDMDGQAEPPSGTTGDEPAEPDTSEPDTGAHDEATASDKTEES